ncbi:MAG: PH domain-containing protein [Microthrixaceae bacterium]
MEVETVARWDLVTRVCGLIIHGGGALGAFLALPVVLGVPAAVSILVSAVRYWRIAVVIGPSNLTVRNWGRTHVVPWSEVTGWAMASDHLMVEVADEQIYMEGTKQFPLPRRASTRRVEALLRRLVEQVRSVEKEV